MARKAISRKFRRRYGYKRYKSVSMNYFKVKMEYCDRIIFPEMTPLANNAKIYGGPAKFKTRALLPNDEPYKITLQSVLDQYMYTNSLKAIFAYYKLTGIRVELIPESRNTGIYTTYEAQDAKYVVPYPMIFFSYRSGTNDAQNVADCRANNQSIVLDPCRKISRYWRVYGTTSTFVATGSAFSGAFSIRNEYPQGADADSSQTRGLMVYELQPSWQVKISVYYLYKYSRA